MQFRFSPLPSTTVKQHSTLGDAQKVQERSDFFKQRGMLRRSRCVLIFL